MAALHFNYNLRRKTGTDKNGNPKLRVTYPKFKGGETTVREVRGEQNYGMYKPHLQCMVAMSIHRLSSIKPK